MATVKDQFENTMDFWVGVVIIDRKGESKGHSIAPHERIWLSKDEQALTAEAPRLAKDNPLANGRLKLVQSGANIESSRPLRPVEGLESSGTVVESPLDPVPPTPNGAPAPAPGTETGAKAPGAPAPSPTGARQPNEQVGTPQAVGK